MRLWVTDLGLGLGVALLFTYLTLVPALSRPAGMISQTRLRLRAACRFAVCALYFVRRIVHRTLCPLRAWPRAPLGTVVHWFAPCPRCCVSPSGRYFSRTLEKAKTSHKREERLLMSAL